jgi:hypothetical protein
LITLNIDRTGACHERRQAVLTSAGVVVLLGLSRGWFVNLCWHLLTAFAGLNMIQASFTGFCPAAIVFRRLDERCGNVFS